MKQVTVTNRLTGETVEYAVETSDQVILALDMVMAWLDTYKTARVLIERRAADILREKMEKKV